jgi:DNA polymerase-1
LSKTCLILDCFALTYRAFFGLPTTIRTQNGNAINAVLGFYNTVSSLIKQFQPDFLFVASDCPQPTFRHLLYSQYKAQRPPMPEDLKSQIPLIKELIHSLSIPLIEMPGYEADDVIGTISSNVPENTHCYIITTDRDALQLAAENVTIIAPNSRANKVFTPEIIQYETGIPPHRVPDLKALMGDASDNIPGVPLVGPKTASRWLKKYGSVENVLDNAHQLKGKAGANLANSKEEVMLYKKLATIDCNVPTYYCWKAGRLRFDANEVRTTLDNIGIRAAIPDVG